MLLTEIFERQANLQAAMGHPYGHGEPAAKENLNRAWLEVSEAMKELNYKLERRDTRPVDIAAFTTEVGDAMQFMVNALVSMGVTAPAFETLLRAKWRENERRIADGVVAGTPRP